MKFANTIWKPVFAGIMIGSFLVVSSSCGTNTGSATERGYQGSDTEHMEEEIEQAGQKVDHNAGQSDNHNGEANTHSVMPTDSSENKTDKVDTENEILKEEDQHK